MRTREQLASKLRGWVSADPLLREKNISASFGIACYPLHGSSPQELIQVAKKRFDVTLANTLKDVALIAGVRSRSYQRSD